MEYMIDENIPEDLKGLGRQILNLLAELPGVSANTANSHGEGQRKRRFPSDEEIADSLRQIANNNGKGQNGPRFPSGEDIMNSRGLPRRTQGINLIPSDKYGYCCETLVVIICPKTDFKERMHDAHHHVNVNCKGFTKNVIFVSFIWNEVIWKEFVSGSRRGAFKDTTCTIVLPSQERMLLLKT